MQGFKSFCSASCFQVRLKLSIYLSLNHSISMKVQPLWDVHKTRHTIFDICLFHTIILWVNFSNNFNVNCEKWLRWIKFKFLTFHETSLRNSPLPIPPITQILKSKPFPIHYFFSLHFIFEEKLISQVELQTSLFLLSCFCFCIRAVYRGFCEQFFKFKKPIHKEKLFSQ